MPARLTIALLPMLTLALVACDGGGYVSYESRFGKFRVDVPADPGHMATQSWPLQTPLGKVTTFTETVTHGEITLQVSYRDLPATELKTLSPDAVLDFAAAAAVDRLAGQGAEAEPIKLGDYPGRQVIFKTSLRSVEAIVVRRIYLAGNRIYEVSIMTPPKSIDTEAAVRFMDSFEVMADGTDQSS